MTVRVDGVVVIPMQDGYAYTHTDDGRCVLLSGSRARMIDLCRAVKDSQQTGGPEIYVDALEFPDFGFLSVEECPLHGHAAA